MDTRAATDVSTTPASSTSDTVAVTPTLTSTDTLSQSGVREVYTRDSMDGKARDSRDNTSDREKTEDSLEAKKIEQKAQNEDSQSVGTKKTKKCRKAGHKKMSKSIKSESKKSKKKDNNDDSDSSESESSSSSESSEDDTSSSEDERRRTRSKKSRRSKKVQSKKSKSKGKKRTIREDSDESDSESESSSNDSVSERNKTKRKKLGRKSKKIGGDSSTDDGDDGAEDPDLLDELISKMETLKSKWATTSSGRAQSDAKPQRRATTRKTVKGKKKVPRKKDSSDYKRVDQLWDSNIHNYKLKESAEEDESEFAEFAFLVRRRFDWENKYLHTVVDIKSKELRAALAEVMKECKSVSLEAEEPTIDPNILFLYLEELRTYYKKTLKTRIRSEKKKKNQKKLETQRALCKTLVSYIDEDYAETKKTLYPLLEAGNITFDLLWALFHPNEIAVTSTYGVWDEPRCFKAEYANKFCSMARGEWYCVEGKYMEYDGKHFGFGDFEVDVDSFKGPRKITSLATYPLKYHKDAESLKKQLIERGKRFVAMQSMNYRFHKGLAFMKKKKQVAKININGRVMVDPATFRRINPNYQVSVIKAREAEELFSDSDADSDDCSCCGDNEKDESERIGHGEKLEQRASDVDGPKLKYKYVEDEDGCLDRVAVEVDENGDPIREERVEQLEGPDETTQRTFTNEELLLTTSVVLGFAFSEKLWLEFTLSGVREIEYNEKAFESLVLPPNQKSIVRALVESHKFNAAKTIDDVVQGKGKGLVAVLHGPPGTGKTLTAEGISELLKCPLYMVSAGELGTDPARLELELQKILDIAHSWGAVLLLDEADVFLEKREVHDIHRNALVSIFLRLLEYFQGILFLTTNRVETFDDAFQSRIHVALRYGELTTKAKKTVWKMFLDLCRKRDSGEVAELSEDELDVLSRHQLNGRQIKNVVRTAQALALNEKEKLTLSHIKRVLDVAETFDRDLKGGTGYIDAMRSYT